MIIKSENNKNILPLFEGWNETIIWSCLQNIMGAVYVNEQNPFASAMAILGDFCFFAGVPDEELAGYKPKGCRKEFMIMVPQNEAWAGMIEKCYKEKAKRVTRYATKKEPGVFQRERLKEAAASISSEYSLKLIDEGLFSWCKEQVWCRDLVAQYDSFARFRQLGLGVVALKDGVPVSGASSYSSFQGGIEIEIDTKKEYRRKGLAFACGARLILECLERSLYPSWDAQNKGSLALAQKLGYHYAGGYPAYEIRGY